MCVGGGEIEIRRHAASLSPEFWKTLIYVSFRGKIPKSEGLSQFVGVTDLPRTALVEMCSSHSST